MSNALRRNVPVETPETPRTRDSYGRFGSRRRSLSPNDFSVVNEERDVQ